MDTELKSGGVPHGITHRLGYWKAEEMRKFAFPASEYVVDCKKSRHYLGCLYHCVCCTIVFKDNKTIISICLKFKVFSGFPFKGSEENQNGLSSNTIV